MRILDRYISKNIIVSVLIVLFVLLSLFAFFQYLDELKDVGKGRYDAGKAFMFVLMSLPTLIYQLLPMTVLLGCTIGLGVLASNSELTAMRSAGVSLEHIMGSVFKISLVIIVAGVIVGEWLAPKSEHRAQTMRSVAMSNNLTLRGSQGLWAKDGPQYINVRKILPGKRLASIYVYEVDHQHHVTHVLWAATAIYRGNNWVLQNVVHSYLVKGNVVAHREKEHIWDTALSPELLNVVTVKPNTLSVWGLYQYIEYLESNGLSSDQYKQSMWSKLMLPVVAGVMVLLSISFVFGPLRSVSIANRIVTGVLIGIGYHLFSQMFSYLGLVIKLNPAFTALMPTLLAMLLAVVLIRRIY